MKKTSIIVSLLAVLCLTAFARQSYERNTRRIDGSLKQLNTRPHRQTAATSPIFAAPMKAEGEVPENAVEVPFSHDLGKNSENVDIVKNYTEINANEDGRSWKIATVNNYSACMPPNEDGIDAADDWMISVPVHMKAGNYNVSIDLGIMGSGATGITAELKLGTAPTVEGMTTTIAPVTVYTDKDQKKYEYSCVIPEEGYYYFGLHNLTTKEQNGTVKFFNLSVEAGIEAPENAITAPFEHNLGKNSSDVDIVKNYTFIDANDDGRSWKIASMSDYSACMAPNSADIEASDDWMISVPVYMTTGNYTVSVDLGYMGTGATGITAELKLGTAPTVEGMIAEIAPVTVYTAKDKTTYEYPCAIPNDGYYYIGLHNLTTKEQNGTVKFFNLGVKAGEVVKIDPPAAGTLTWVLAPKGELKATVTYTAPVKTVSGDDLAEISKVVITSRWGVDSYTFDDVKPGQEIVVDVDMYAGINNRFTGVAYVGDVAGEQVEHKSIFCGPDTPFPPTDVKLVPSDDYKSATLSWTAPGEVGEHGGYVDVDRLVYYIFDAFGSYYDPAIATTDKTSYVIEYPDLEGQDFFAYQVTAGVDDYYSLDEVSNIVVIGTPASLPFTESFTDGYYDGMWLSETDTDYLMQRYGTMDDSYFSSLIDPDDPDAPAPLKSHDGDNGFFFWLPIDKDAMFGLISVRADISQAANPVLEFWYQGQGSTIDVLVASGQNDLSVVKTIDLQTEPAGEWTLARVPLADFKADGSVQFEIRLTATHNDDEHTWSVPIDDISVRDLVDTDLRIFPMSAPSKVAPGDKVNISAHIENLGTQATPATAQFYVGDEMISELDLGQLDPYAFADAKFEYPVSLCSPEVLDLRIVAVAEGDEMEANNTTEASLEVVYSIFPTVTDLTATPSAEDNSVALSWTAPDWTDLTDPVSVVEDFENPDYTPMSISGAGDWMVVDGDKEYTFNIFREYNNPYQTMPMGFQLFNREVAEVPDMYWEDAQPHSGDSFMMAPSGEYALNDNWLISPRLSGNEQTITFWAKSFSLMWPESFTLYYSTTGNTVDCFTEYVEDESGNSFNVPEQWTMFSFTLPAGATYFAINHDSYDSLALLVDDITYEGASAVPADLAVTGYHIFRDGVQLTDEPVEENAFVDRLPDSGVAGTVTHSYSVVTVYNHGTSRPADVDVEVTQSGLAEIGIDTLNGTETIYNLSGMRISATDIVPGIYIIVNNDKASKAILK